MTEFFGALISILSLRMPVPTPFGWFHLMFIALTAVAAFLLCHFVDIGANRGTDKGESVGDDKSLKRLLLTYALLCIGFEIIKQLQIGFDYSDGVITTGFEWYSFPFQFCSIPMYAALIGALTKNSRVREACVSFIATYGLLGGLLVMLVPGNVFVGPIIINIQTMVHHGSQIAVGICLLMRCRLIASWRAFFGGVAVFLSAVVVACALNEAIYPLLRGADSINMFLISRHYTSTLPVFNTIQGKIPYILFVLLYTVPFTAAAASIHALRNTLPRAFSRLRAKKSSGER